MSDDRQKYEANQCLGDSCEVDLEPLPEDFNPKSFLDPVWGYGDIDKLCPTCGRGYGINTEGDVRMSLPDDVYRLVSSRLFNEMRSYGALRVEKAGEVFFDFKAT